MKTISRLIILIVVIGISVSLGVKPMEAQPAVSVFFNDLAGFDAAAGSPPVPISFDDIPIGTDITGATLFGVTFDLGNQPAPSAPLVVVRGADTFTPAGFVGVIDPTTNKLFPTGGENVLSPGGLELAPGNPADNIPGVNPTLQNDDLRLTFDPPVSAVGFDVLFQSLDFASYVGITVFGPGGEVLFSNPLIPTGSTAGGGAPGGSVFVGFASTSANIATIIIDDFDDNNGPPDANIGYDTFRISVPPVCTTVLDDFNRRNGRLGQPWRGAEGRPNYRIVNRQLDPEGGGPIYWPTIFGPDQVACVTLTHVDPNGEHQSVLLKIQGDWRQGAVAVFYDAVAEEVGIETFVPGRGWRDLITVPMRLRDGDQLAGRALANGKVQAFVNDFLITETTVEPMFHDRIGQIGLWFIVAADAVLDDFGGGTVVP